MPRGRPKGSKNKPKVDVSNVQTFSIVNILEEKSKEVSHDDYLLSKEEQESLKDKLKVISQCDLCGKDIYSSPHTIQLNLFTGLAYWHRNCKTNILSLCEDCAKQFNQMVEEFILSKNPQLKKYDLE